MEVSLYIDPRSLRHLVQSYDHGGRTFLLKLSDGRDIQIDRRMTTGYSTVLDSPDLKHHVDDGLLEVYALRTGRRLLWTDLQEMREHDNAILALGAPKPIVVAVPAVVLPKAEAPVVVPPPAPPIVEAPKEEPVKVEPPPTPSLPAFENLVVEGAPLVAPPEGQKLPLPHLMMERTTKSLKEEIDTIKKQLTDGTITAKQYRTYLLDVKESERTGRGRVTFTMFLDEELRALDGNTTPRSFST